MTETAKPANRRVIVSLVTFVIWVLATLFLTRLYTPATQVPLSETVNHGISWNIAAAAALVLGVAAVMRWHDLGFVRPLPGTLRVMWFPSLYLIGFLLLAVILGFPPAQTMLFLVLNTALVGLSEEGMFRGVLFRAFRGVLSLWPAVILSTLMFGGVHVLNVFVTGQFLDSAIQALAAGLSGFVFIAILLRTGSILPAILYHAAWDLGTFVVSSNAGGETPLGDLSPMMRLVPVLIVLPNFLYAVFLLRNQGNDPPVASSGA